MAQNKANMLKAKRQISEGITKRALREMCSHRVLTYNVVSKIDGTVVARNVPIEYITNMGTQVFGYTLYPNQ